jgi:hypothetical protein
MGASCPWNLYSTFRRAVRTPLYSPGICESKAWFLLASELGMRRLNEAAARDGTLTCDEPKVS